MKSSFYVGLVLLSLCICLPLFPAFGAELNLGASWNLVSSRVSIDTSAVFGDKDLESVWKWENGIWAVMLPKQSDKGKAYANSKGFEFLSKIEPGEGFWVNSKESTTIPLTGTEVNDPNITLIKYWNLKGLRCSTPVNVKDLFSDKEKYASVWKWVSSSWAVYLPGQTDGGLSYAKQKGFSPLQTINPGEGFWVNASKAGEVVATPPVVAGTVTYPTQEIGLQKIGLYLKGLLAEIPQVEMPPVPGATVKVYATTNPYTPLAETTTDNNGNYSFSNKDFDNPETPEMELPPQVPLMVKAEFKSPIDPTKKVAVQALVDPTDDPTKKAKLEVNPLTTAIAQKVKEFVENTFQVQLTKEIMDAAKTFIELIATEVQKKGLTFFDEDDLVVGEYKDAASDEENPDFQPPTDQNIADKVIDKGTNGLFVNMESKLMEQANKGALTNVNVSNDKKIEHYIKYLVSLGIKVQAGKDGDDSQKVIVFIAAPPTIPDNLIPGTMVFNDKAFRKIKPETDLTPEKINAIPDLGFRFYLKDALEGPMVSYEAVEAFMQKAEEGLTTNLTKLAAVVKDKFVWRTESVQMVNGIPIFGEDMVPTTGEEVSASELISQLTGKLGNTPEEIAKGIAITPAYLVKFFEPLVNQKMNEIHNNKNITDKQQAMNQFLKSLKDIETLKNEVMKTEFFKHAVEEISHAIFAAFEPDLYGKVLSGSTELKVKSAFVLLKQMIERVYLVDATKGWFITHQEGENSWISPNYTNFKFLSPKDEENFEFANQIFSSALGTTIGANSNFATLAQAYWSAVDNLPEPEQFKFNNDAMQGIVGQKSVTVTVNGILKDSDGATLPNTALQLRKLEKDGFNTVQTVNTDGNGKFTFQNVQTGFSYQIYNDTTKVFLNFFADGFVNPIELGDWVMPPSMPTGGGGGEAAPMVVPGITLFVDDTFFNPVNPNDPQNGKPVGVKFGNFATGQPFITTDADLFWTKDGLKAGTGATIAEFQGKTKGVLGLAQLKPTFTQAELKGESLIQIKDEQFKLQWTTLIQSPKEGNSIYVIKDTTGKYFLVEVRFWDKDQEGKPSGIIDMGFVSISSSGQIQVPKESFIVGPGEPGQETVPFSLLVGDYLDLDSKAFSPPPGEPMGVNQEVIDEADLRWLGNFYENYWKDADWQQKMGLLKNSDRALSTVNGATMKVLTISGNAVALTPVNELKPTLQGQVFLLSTNKGKEFVVAVMMVNNMEINLLAVPKEKLISTAGQLLEGIVDNDKDGIPNVLDPNDFDPNVPGKGQMQPLPGPKGLLIPNDPDGDGIPFEMDPAPNDPNLPFQGGNLDEDKDGLPKGFEEHFGFDDKDPQKPGFMGPPISAQGQVKLALASGDYSNNFNNSVKVKLLGPNVGSLMVMTEEDGTKKVNLICLIRDAMLKEISQWVDPSSASDNDQYSIVILDDNNTVVGYLINYRIVKKTQFQGASWQLQQYSFGSEQWVPYVYTVIPFEVFDGV